MTTTYTIGEIMRLFDVDAGDAWMLVIDNDWECERPDEKSKWQITIPENQLLKDA